MVGALAREAKVPLVFEEEMEAPPPALLALAVIATVLASVIVAVAASVVAADVVVWARVTAGVPEVAIVFDKLPVFLIGCPGGRGSADPESTTNRTRAKAMPRPAVTMGLSGALILVHSPTIICSRK